MQRVVQLLAIQRDSIPRAFMHVAHQSKGRPLYNRIPNTRLGFDFSFLGVVILPLMRSASMYHEI